jgi:hypothetical protein
VSTSTTYKGKTIEVKVTVVEDGYSVAGILSKATSKLS